MAVHIIGISLVLEHAHEVDILSVGGVELAPLLFYNIIQRGQSKLEDNLFFAAISTVTLWQKEWHGELDA